ncbi:MAG TPA: hypothetical protein K8U76_06955 [Bilophila wadsworthia]|uniref:hypothetical protein n=1 Tax=Bilophila wadsworthia TaxID=35833 RepID=UPI001DBE4131|nr:hypothetical protein [Bilophila wadsworthia]HJH14992.1 hypothetical protein [Bilophila wadsworthia]
MARLMPGSLAAAFFPSVCRRFQDGSLEVEHRFAFPGDAGETAAAGCSGRASTLRARVRANQDTRLISSPSQPS